MNDLDEMLAAETMGDGRVDALIEEARLARRSGDTQGALAAYRRALAIEPRHPAVHLECAVLERQLGQPRQALKSCLTALDIDPRNMEARVELAEVLVLLGRSDEAHAIHGLLVRQAPYEAASWYALGRLLADEKRAAGAEAAFRRALALAPGHPGARLGLARLLVHRAPEAAVDAFHDVLAVAPDDPDAHAGLAAALIRLDRFDEAADRLERALALDEEHVGARLERARLRILTGDLAGAGEDAQWRWHLPGKSRPELGAEPWQGGPLAGRSLLLWPEESLSDVIQYARYVPGLAAQGSKVHLVVHPRLVSLMGEVAGHSWVVPTGHPFPEAMKYDLTASFNDLPLLCGGDIPAAPYLSAPEGRVRPLETPPGVRLKVGLSWAGSPNPAAEVPFAELLCLAEVDGVALFSLQSGPRAAVIAQQAHPALVTDLDPTVFDFADMAGRIAALDVIITADGPVAHIAAAMGKPVWLLAAHTADPRWLRDRDDSPWYPSLRIFRQPAPGDWGAVVAKVRGALAGLASPAPQPVGAPEQGEAGAPAQLRLLLDAHLEAGDLFVDVEAGDGTFTLAAAGHPAGEVRVLALEPRAADAEALKGRLAAAGVAEGVVEVVAAAIGDRAGHALVSKTPRDGRRVFPAPQWMAGAVPLVPLDTVLSQHPEASARRVVMRLGQAGWEAEAVQGLTEWLALGNIAAILWEHREGSAAAERLTGAGFGLWRFPTPEAAGALAAFAGEPGAVLALAPGLKPRASYGEAATAAPPDLGDAMAEAARQRAELYATAAVEHHRTGKLGEAVRSYTRALMEDPFNSSANANLATILRMNGRLHAAAACCRRAMARGMLPGVASNLGNALREMDRAEAAEAAVRSALELQPDNVEYQFNLALALRRQGREAEAGDILARIRAQAGGGFGWELAQVRMKLGRTAEGFALFDTRRRPAPPLPAVPEWDGGDVVGKRVLVHDEGDIADTLMLARYLPLLAHRGALVTFSCLPEAVRLLGALPGVEATVATGREPNGQDLRVALADLPRLLGGILPRDIPYLHLPDGVASRSFRADGLKVGLSWAGRATTRNCPLERMLALAAHPRVSLFGIENGERRTDIAAVGGRAFIEDVGRPRGDLADTAAAIAALDLVIAGDTPAAHIAGAMGKPVWVLLPRHSDWRWPANRQDTPWYPGMRLFRQSPDGGWDEAIERMLRALDAAAAR